MSMTSISIHAPRTGSDSATPNAIINMVTFQSTLPARGATPRAAKGAGRPANFNPRSPHGERPNAERLTEAFLCISIHAPRTGSDAFRAAAFAAIV